MTNVIDIQSKISGNVQAKTGAITVRVLQVDGKKMTKSFFRQIPPVHLEKWPARYLGWVQDRGPWLLWADQNGRLKRSNISRWRTERGTGDPVTDIFPQLYLS